MFIRVVPYDPFWEVEYENESQKIKNILKDILVEVYHIGSTAVKGLAAKSIIDIMPVVTNISLVDKHNKEFVAIGYECMGEFGIEGRRYFRKGGDNRTHQIHMFSKYMIERGVRSTSCARYSCVQPLASLLRLISRPSA